MKYCRENTKKQTVCLIFPDCLEDINSLMVKEGCIDAMPFFINGEVVINCDTVEAELAKAESRNKNKSMDMAFAVSDSYNIELVLVEIRLNYINPNNLNRISLIGKESSTRAVFNNINIHKEVIFIFNTAVKAEARNRIARMLPAVPVSFIVMDLSELKHVFF